MAVASVALSLGVDSMLFSGFGTIVGFGGGVFMIPVMVVLFGIKMTYAIGAVTLALFPASLISTVHNWRENLVDPVAGIWLETPTILGTILGAWLTSKLSATWLEIVFSIFLCYVAMRMFRQHDSETPPSRLITRLNGIGPVLKRERYGCSYTMGTGATVFFGGIAGLVAGLFGIGGGFLKTPIMIRVFRMPAKVAVATALFMIVFTSATAICSHWMLGHIDLRYGLPVIIGFSVGALVGNNVKGKISDLHTERLIAVGLSLATVATFVHALIH